MGLFSKPLLDTTIEVLCQNTGRTFRIYTRQARKSLTCRACGRETFIVNLREGRGNITVEYIGADESHRMLDKVEIGPHIDITLATVDATSGTFILIEQKKQ